MNTIFISYIGTFTGSGYLLWGITGAVGGFTLACSLLVVAELYKSF